jgi:hypothetical protein
MSCSDAMHECLRQLRKTLLREVLFANSLAVLASRASRFEHVVLYPPIKCPADTFRKLEIVRVAGLHTANLARS